jgi:hypothetical protein
MLLRVYLVQIWTKYHGQSFHLKIRIRAYMEIFMWILPYITSCKSSAYILGEYYGVQANLGDWLMAPKMKSNKK